MEDEEVENLSKNSHSVPLITNVSYDFFFENFLLRNVPCLINNIGRDWKATAFWTQSDKPCFDYLKKNYGESSITAYKCDEKYFNSQKTCGMKFDEFLNYWRNYIEKEYSNSLPLYYLKDWHLRNEFKDDNFYEVPVYFSSDWLNEYLTNCNKDDYRFVYMGPKGSWTPFHQDVFSSYSWSINICGKKRWILFPPGEEQKLIDDLGNLPYNIEKIPKDVQYYEVIQHPGHALFVPSRWHHQVWNLKNTISINHNWINGCNIKFMWEELDHNLSSVKKEISDCVDMENYHQQCQIILRATFGMNFEDFFSFVQFIALKRLEALSHTCQEVDNHSHKKYVAFDLNSLKEVLKLFKAHKDLDTYPELIKLKKNASEILEKILTALKE